MTPEISRRVGRALGKAKPGPTPPERRKILKGLEGVSRWRDVPAEVRQLVTRLEASAG